MVSYQVLLGTLVPLGFIVARLVSPVPLVPLVPLAPAALPPALSWSTGPPDVLPVGWLPSGHGLVLQRRLVQHGGVRGLVTRRLILNRQQS